MTSRRLKQGHRDTAVRRRRVIAVTRSGTAEVERRSYPGSATRRPTCRQGSGRVGGGTMEEVGPRARQQGPGLIAARFAVCDGSVSGWICGLSTATVGFAQTASQPLQAGGIRAEEKLALVDCWGGHGGRSR